MLLDYVLSENSSSHCNEHLRVFLLQNHDHISTQNNLTFIKVNVGFFLVNQIDEYTVIFGTHHELDLASLADIVPVHVGIGL